MNALGRFNERKPQKEWGYSLSFSFFVHIVIFSLAFFAASLPSTYRKYPVYSVNLVDLPSQVGGGLPSGGPEKSAEGEKKAARQIKSPPAPPKIESHQKPAAPIKSAKSEVTVHEEKKSLQEEYDSKLKSLTAKRKKNEQAESKREEVLKSALSNIKERVSKEKSQAAVESQKASILEKLKKDLGQKDSKMKGALAGIRERILGENTGGGTGGPKGSGPDARGGIAAERLYEAQLKAKVEKNWFDVRQWNRRKDLITIVLIKLSRNGKVEDCTVRKGSGNPAVDESVRRAIYKSSPFAPVPPEILDTTVEVRFCPGEIIS